MFSECRLGLIFSFWLAVLIAVLCTINIENQALASFSQKPPDEKTKMNNPGALTVYGQFQYINKDSQRENADMFFVQLLGQYSDVPLTYGTTSTGGGFWLGPVENPQNKIRIKIYAYF